MNENHENKPYRLGFIANCNEYDARLEIASVIADGINPRSEIWQNNLFDIMEQISSNYISSAGITILFLEIETNWDVIIKLRQLQAKGIIVTRTLCLRPIKKPQGQTCGSGSKAFNHNQYSKFNAILN